MNRSGNMPMRSWRTVAGAGLACFVLAACGDAYFDPNGVTVVVEPPDAVDMSGSWSLTVNPEDRPGVFECTGDLPPDGFTFCDAFVVTISQNGEFFSSESADDESARFCDSFFEMSGVATLQEISGVIRRGTSRVAPSVESQEMEFRAGVLGNSATLALVRLTVHGREGECLLGGSYVAVRATSP